MEQFLTQPETVQPPTHEAGQGNSARSQEQHTGQVASAEHMQGAEQLRQGPGAPSQPFIAPPSAPPALQSVKDDKTTKPQDDDDTLLAEDVDVIEREWVDKAKQIVASTKGDPYMQEAKVSKLQGDYLKKRYGKELKQAKE